jgi:hypothetical protein
LANVAQGVGETFEAPGVLLDVHAALT